MRKIASPEDLHAELTTLMERNRQGASRDDLAASLQRLAGRVAATSEIEEFVAGLEEEWAYVKYDAKRETGEARVGWGLIKFHASTNDSAVWVETPVIKFKARAAGALEAIEGIRKIINNTGA